MPRRVLYIEYVKASTTVPIVCAAVNPSHREPARATRVGSTRVIRALRIAMCRATTAAASASPRVARAATNRVPAAEAGAAHSWLVSTDSDSEVLVWPSSSREPRWPMSTP